VTRAAPAEPPRDCPLCPRLVEFRKLWRERQPAWHNAPVPSFGDRRGRLLIIGLAPGLRGANRTGRPFTGDYSGELLYATLLKCGFARGVYRADPADDLKLADAAIVNAVRCVPPQNKPTAAEIANCRPFLESAIAAHVRARVIVALGRIAHETTLRALGLKPGGYRFAHGALHHCGKYRLYDSYHCSRQNTNTGRLTPEMFEAVFEKVANDLSGPSSRS
jgi:uracil-DNA glycosylase family 4